MFNNAWFQPGKTRYARPQLGHFIQLHGEPSAVAAVAAALDVAALPPDPAATRREKWEAFDIAKSVILVETESRVWPVTVTVASSNAAKAFFHKLATAHPGVTIVHDMNVRGVDAKIIFSGENVIEHEAMGGSFSWIEIRPNQWVHPSVLVVSDFEKPRAMTRLPESAMQPRR